MSMTHATNALFNDAPGSFREPVTGIHFALIRVYLRLGFRIYSLSEHSDPRNCKIHFRISFHTIPLAPFS
jgi:hypothetical protein